MRNLLVAIALLIVISCSSYFLFIKTSNPTETGERIMQSGSLPLDMRPIRKDNTLIDNYVYIGRTASNVTNNILKKNTLNIEKLMREQINNQERVAINELLNKKRDVFNGDGSEQVEGSHEVAIQVFDDAGNLIVVYVNSPLPMVGLGSSK